MTNTSAALPPSGAPKLSTRVRIVLAVSLAANLLLAGFVVGQVIHHPWREHGGQLTIERLTGKMPPEVRDVVRASLRERRPEIANKVAAVREARAEVRAAIGAEPFDPARLAAAFAAVRERSRAVQEDVQSAAVEAIAKLPSDVRRKLSM
jgi:uncharacterized membrane protein